MYIWPREVSGCREMPSFYKRNIQYNQNTLSESYPYSKMLSYTRHLVPRKPDQVFWDSLPFTEAKFLMQIL